VGVRDLRSLSRLGRGGGANLDPAAAGGVWLLLASMARALVFGLAFHFLIFGLDNVFTLNPGAGREAFVVSVVLVAFTEVLGCVVGVWALSKLPRSAEGAAGMVRPRRSSGEEVR